MSVVWRIFTITMNIEIGIVNKPGHKQLLIAAAVLLGILLNATQLFVPCNITENIVLNLTTVTQ